MSATKTINAYACLEQNAKLTPWTYQVPTDLPPKEVEIEVEYCGVCHSDLSMITGEFPFGGYPMVLGHEVIGIVRAVGSEVTNKGLIGKRVGLGWQRGGFCQSCKSCSAGDLNLCATADGTITGSNRGGFADFVRAEALAVVPIPDSVNPATAGPLLCGGVTVWTPIAEYVKSPTARVGVVGIGGLGSMALQMLSKTGCSVVAFTSTPAKAEQCKAFGATEVINSTDPKAIRAANLDLIIVTVNVELDWSAYLDALTARGRLHFVGAVSTPISFSVFSLMMGMKSVSSSPTGSPNAIRDMLEFCGRHKIEPIVEEFPLEKINDAVAKVADGTIRYRGVIKIKKQ
jgi:uncharacterized zinc-type alcohol dehydrogenase-like protein